MALPICVLVESINERLKDHSRSLVAETSDLSVCFMNNLWLCDVLGRSIFIGVICLLGVFVNENTISQGGIERV